MRKNYQRAGTVEMKFTAKSTFVTVLRKKKSTLCDTVNTTTQ